MKTVTYDNIEYAYIKKPNFELLECMITECRGILRKCTFEKVAHLPEGYLSKIKRNPIPLDYIFRIVDNADIKSTVSKEAMIAANGMMPYNILLKLLKILSPEKADVQDLRFREYAEKEFVHIKFDPNDYDAFLDNLTFSLLSLPEHTAKLLYKNRKDAFSDKGIVKILDRYRELCVEEKVNACNALKKFFTSNHYERLSFEGNLSNGYRDVIVETVDRLYATQDKSILSSAKIASNCVTESSQNNKVLLCPDISNVYFDIVRGQPVVNTPYGDFVYDKKTGEWSSILDLEKFDLAYLYEKASEFVGQDLSSFNGLFL